MNSLYPCNHEPYVEHLDGLVIDRCGICGETIWARPAKLPIDWRSVCLALALLLTVVSMLGWLLWTWLRAA